MPSSPSLGELFSKRLFGYVNWMRNRRRALGEHVLDRLLEDVAAQAPDHICVTGDLVNIATEAEFAGAGKFLARLGAPDKITLVPGNHDAYVPGSAARAAKAWAPWIGGDGNGFPTVKRFGPIAIIGVSTAVATPPLFATGRVGPAQRGALAAILDRHDDAYKIVVIHHPPDSQLERPRRGLSDLDAVRQVLAAGCVDLVLHGHTHEESLVMLETARGSAAVVGVPSASSDGSRHAPAGYALVDIRETRVRITRRSFAEERLRTTSVVELPARVPMIYVPPRRQTR